MKNIFIGLVVFILLLLGLWYFTRTPKESTPINEPPNTQQEVMADLPNNYRLHTEPDFGYSIGLPMEVDTSSPQTGITRYRFVGSQNEPGSEITNGFTITIEALQSDESSLENIAAQNIQGNRLRVTQDPIAEQVAGNAALKYTVESELGNKPITYYAFLPGNDFAYIVSINISPEESIEYQNTTTTILKTLTFFNQETAQYFTNRIVPIAMLDYEAVGNVYTKESSGKERGCDKVVLIEHVLEDQTTAPLNESLKQLFSYTSDTVAGWQNFIASQNTTLSFDRAEIADRTAHIYLIGRLGSLGGVCDNPRAAIQIEETALTYDTVDNVELYLNGKVTTLLPNAQGE